jgi:hypothetical protein
MSDIPLQPAMRHAITRAKSATPIDRYVYGSVASVFALLVFIGFSRTYYLRALFAGPPVPSLMVHLHGVVMTSWVLLFLVQVSLIASRRVKVHQRLGYVSIGLAVLIVLIGLRTALEAARHGSLSTPVGFSQPTFSAVPLGDLVLFVLFYGGAVYFRRTASRHKGLMLLTVANFLPPAVGRLPFAIVKANPVVFGLGVPAAVALVAVAYDAWKRRRVDWVLVAAAVLLLASFPARIALIATPAWASASAWLATLVD